MATPIGAEETAGELGDRLARIGGEAVREWLPRYVGGAYTLEPQDDSGATPAPMLEKENGRIDWAMDARQVHDHVRGMSPWPGAFTTARGRPMKVHATRVLVGAAGDKAPGRGTVGEPAIDPAADEPAGPRGGRADGRVVLADKSRVLVACGGGGILELVTVQPEGKRAMRASDWLMGRGVTEGDTLGA